MQRISTHANGAGVRSAEASVKPITTIGRVVVTLDRGIYRIAKHWLLAANSIFISYFTSILLAPALVSTGHPGLARPIYGLNSLFCHQRDNHSFHLFGQKLACCERCAAIYGSIALIGLIFAFIRTRLRRPAFYEVGLLALPMLVDGLGQGAGLWNSTAGSRVLSGFLFGIAVMWFLLPYLESGFAKTRLQIETLFARLVAEGRTTPL